MSTGNDLVVGAGGLLVAAGLAAGFGAAVLARRRAEARPLALRWATLPLLALLFVLSDALLLRMLPWSGLSFGPVAGLPLLASLSVRLLLLLAAVALLGLRGAARGRGKVRAANLLPAFLAANLGFSLLQAYAYVAEPLWIETTELTIASGALDAELPPVHIVQLADLHVERYGPREAAVVRRVNALQPDAIVLTGDYLNLSYLSDPAARAGFRRLVAQLRAPYGLYAVRGTVEPWPEFMAALVEGTGITWLEQEATTLEVRGQRLTLVGVACSHQTSVDAARLSQAMEAVPAQGFRLLLFHSPDLIAEAADRGVDLYLAGHTHGGQIALPFYGPVVTFSRYGRQYAAGQFQVKDTTMYVSRGLGFEGGGLPRARFLARPEIVSLRLGGQ